MKPIAYLLKISVGGEMSTTEWITATLGVLGFLISTAHVAWTIRRHTPRLLLVPKAGHLFQATQSKPCPYFDLEHSSVLLVDLVVDVTNCSATNNTIVSMEWGGGHVTRIDPECSFSTGTRTTDVSAIFGGERTIEHNIYWNAPRQWANILPEVIPQGEHRSAHCCGLVANAESLGTPPQIAIAVTDAFGKTYKTTVVLKHGSPTDEHGTQRGGPAETLGAAGSTQTT